MCTSYLIYIVNIKRVIRKKINILQALSKPCHWKIKVGPRHAFRGFLGILIFQNCVDEMKYSSLDIDIPFSCHKSECDNYIKSHEIDRFYKWFMLILDNCHIQSYDMTRGCQYLKNCTSSDLRSAMLSTTQWWRRLMFLNVPTW